MVKDASKQSEYYGRATKFMARTLLWIDVGWNGINNFAANHEVTKNWTSGAGHFANGEERARYITTNGKKWIDEVVAKYRAARQIYDPKYGENDVFRKYNLEPLLMADETGYSGI